MNHIHKSIFTLFIFSFLSLNLSAQFGPQFDNRGFEQWTTRSVNSVNEPVHWHSSGTATGSYASWLPSNPQIETSTHLRPGSTGTKSLRIIPRSVIGVTANGTVTNGRMNAGSLSASGGNNYNYTQREQDAFNTPITQLPDSLTIWVCFRSQSTIHKAHVKAVVHGDADYKIKANGTEDPADMHVATAEQRFTRTAANGGAYNWTRLSIPFVNDGPCTDVRYILFMATTNESPGTGSTNDDLFVDDVLLIYNPVLSMGQLASASFTPGDVITIPFTLTGTMSPDNLNAAPNEVIAQLSDANGNFDNPTELGRMTTDQSDYITAQIPNVAAGDNYRIRVISTNYPMIGQNIQEISIIESIFTVNVTANPSEGGTVSGGGTYTYGQSCNVSATANDGYLFANWTENGNMVSTSESYSFTVAANRDLVARFVTEGNIIFADLNVKAICVANWDTDGDGELSYYEAAMVTSLGEAFRNRTDIVSFDELQYFTGLFSIDDYAFECCYGLTSVTLPNTLTSIGGYAFKDCSGLTGSMIIPTSVTSIGGSAFYGSAGIGSVIMLSSTVPALGSGAFSGANAEYYIYVPYSSLNDYKTATNWSDYENRIFPMAYTVVPGCGTGEGRWSFIASPLAEGIVPTTVDNMLSGANYDLYQYDQSAMDEEWQNYKAEAFNLVNGQGYLYANAEEVNVIFKGAFNEDDSKEVSLAYDEDKPCPGWNLVGNPFPVTAYLDRDFYVMNDEGNEIVLADRNYIEPMEGVFVVAESDGETLSFSTAASAKSPRLVLNLSGGPSTGSGTANLGTTIIDRAIIRFTEGRMLPKLQIKENSSKLFLKQDGKDYAVVNSGDEGEMLVGFKAEQSGSYTLNFSNENVDFSYLHLIDTLTGVDVDLLEMPSYSFKAKITDKTERFKVEYATEREE